MATHSSTLAWKIPWTEEPGGLQSMGSQRVGHDWTTSLSLFTFMHWRRKWQPTPVFLPGESQGQRSLVGCCLWGRTFLDMTEATQQQQIEEKLSKRGTTYFFLMLCSEYFWLPNVWAFPHTEQFSTSLWMSAGSPTVQCSFDAVVPQVKGLFSQDCPACQTAITSPGLSPAECPRLSRCVPPSTPPVDQAGCSLNTPSWERECVGVWGSGGWCLKLPSFNHLAGSLGTRLSISGAS